MDGVSVISEIEDRGTSCWAFRFTSRDDVFTTSGVTTPP